jgi:hypothetical protein
VGFLEGNLVGEIDLGEILKSIEILFYFFIENSTKSKWFFLEFTFRLIAQATLNFICRNTFSGFTLMCHIINIFEDSNLVLEFFILKISAYKD